MSRLPKLNRPVFLGVVLALAILIGAGAFAARQAANAAEPLEGNRVSAADVRILVRAASSCSALTPARLAGQVMATSNFGSRPVPSMREGGRTGVAALTPEQWRKYAPWPGADPSDTEAGITALAHATCQFVGQARAVKIAQDPWRVALAAYRLGMDQVIAAGDIPGGARDYVDIAERYATWYALQPAFGGGPASPAPATTVGGGAVVPVPGQYVNAVIAAGKVCPEMPPARIAAQIMATSGFDPNRLGPAGEQGIAQFLPQVWTANVKPAPNRTPWEPAAAIRALGGTMCKLVKESGGQYGPALAAFTRGDRDAASPLVEVVTKSQAEYAKDSRLQTPAKTSASSAPPSSAPAKPGKPKPTAKKRNQPPVKAAGGNGSSGYGPYFILNLRTGQCVDLPGFGPGVRDGRVPQYPCAKTGEDNQEWTFMPRATDSAGYQLYWIRNVDDNFCIDAPGVGKVPSSSNLSETGCSDQDNQYFRLEPKLTSGGFQYYWLRNTVADMCIDVPGPGTGGPDARLALVPCMSNDDHEWALVQKSEW
jgi:hypothetical protein